MTDRRHSTSTLFRTPPTLRRAGELALFGAVPLVALVLALAAFAGDGRLALDFHEELYRQADAIVHGRDVYPSPEAPIVDTTNAVWPVAAVLPVVPLTAIPPGAADWVATAIVLAAFAAALWTLGVRDWRVYGVASLWPPVIDAYQTANVTLVLVLLVAVMWRYRDHLAIPGVALGAALALKFFLWPVAIWLVATGRHRAAALSVTIGAASLLLLLPFIAIPDYLRLLRSLGDAFDGLSYTPYALLVDLGSPSTLARTVTIGVGAGVVALAWRRRSLGLAVGAALVLSPIVWRHFFALLLVPVALSRPRLDWLWAIPLAFWLVPGTGNGDPWQTALGLVAFAATLVVSETGSVSGVRLSAPRTASA